MPPVERIRTRLTRAVAWNATGTAFNQGSTFVVYVVLARVFTLEAFGQYAMIATTLAVIAALAPLSTAYTATKYLAEYRERDRGRAGRILGLCAAIAVAMSAIASLALLTGAGLLAAALHEPLLTTGLRIAALVVFFSVTNAFLTGALAGLESYTTLGRIGVISGISYVALCGAGGVTWGVNGALAGAALTGLVQACLLWPVLLSQLRSRGIRLDLAGARQELRIFLMFSLPAALNGFVSLPAIWFANATLARQPEGYEQMALFTAANSFRIIVLFGPNILNGVGMSILNNQRGAGDERGFRRLFWINWVATGGVALVIGLAVLVTAPWLLGLFGDEFRGAQLVLLILMGAALAEALVLAGSQVVQSQGRIWLSFFGVVGPAYLTLLGTALLLAPRFGALGLAFAYAACWVVALIAMSGVVWRLGVWVAPEVPAGQAVRGSA